MYNTLYSMRVCTLLRKRTYGSHLAISISSLERDAVAIDNIRCFIHQQSVTTTTSWTTQAPCRTVSGNLFFVWKSMV